MSNRIEAERDDLRRSKGVETTSGRSAGMSDQDLLLLHPEDLGIYRCGLVVFIKKSDSCGLSILRWIGSDNHLPVSQAPKGNLAFKIPRNRNLARSGFGGLTAVFSSCSVDRLPTCPSRASCELLACQTMSNRGRETRWCCHLNPPKTLLRLSGNSGAGSFLTPETTLDSASTRLTGQHATVLMDVQLSLVDALP